MTVVFLVLAALGGIVYVIIQKYERGQSATTTDAVAPAPRRDWLGFVGTSAQLLGQLFKIAWILLGMGLVILIIVTAIHTAMTLKH